MFVMVDAVQVNAVQVCSICTLNSINSISRILDLASWLPASNVHALSGDQHHDGHGATSPGARLGAFFPQPVPSPVPLDAGMPGRAHARGCRQNKVRCSPIHVPARLAAWPGPLVSGETGRRLHLALAAATARPMPCHAMPWPGARPAWVTPGSFAK